MKSDGKPNELGFSEWVSWRNICAVCAYVSDFTVFVKRKISSKNVLAEISNATFACFASLHIERCVPAVWHGSARYGRRSVCVCMCLCSDNVLLIVSFPHFFSLLVLLLVCLWWKCGVSHTTVVSCYNVAYNDRNGTASECVVLLPLLLCDWNRNFRLNVMRTC